MKRLVLSLFVIFLLGKTAACADLRPVVNRLEQEQIKLLNCGLNQNELKEAAKIEMKRKGLSYEMFAETAKRMKILAEALREVVVKGAKPKKMYNEKKLAELGYTQGNWEFYLKRYTTAEKLAQFEASIPDEENKILDQMAGQLRPMLEKLLLSSRILCEFDKLSPTQTGLSSKEKMTKWWQDKIGNQGLTEEETSLVLQMLSIGSMLPEADQKFWKEQFKSKITGQANPDSKTSVHDSTAPAEQK